MARLAASRMFSGVSKSGSPAPSPITSRPAALSARALSVTAMVAEGLMRLRFSASRAMRISSSPRLGASFLKARATGGKTISAPARHCDPRHSIFRRAAGQPTATWRLAGAFVRIAAIEQNHPREDAMKLTPEQIAAFDEQGYVF